jgi:hypothetical protein
MGEIVSAIGLQPRYCAVADVVAARDVAHILTAVSPIDRLALLVLRQFGLAAEPQTHLRLDALTVRGHACIASNHGRGPAAEFCNRKALLNQ